MVEIVTLLVKYKLAKSSENKLYCIDSRRNWYRKEVLAQAIHNESEEELSM